MKRVARELFGRSKTYVAVRPIVLTSKVTIQPGEEVDEYNVRQYQKQHWYRLRRIGVKGAAWTEAMLKDMRTHAKPEVVVKEESDEAVTTLQAPQSTEPEQHTDEQQTEPTAEQAAQESESTAVPTPWS